MLPPLKLLMQQHMAAGVRRPRRPVLEVRQSYRIGPSYGPRIVPVERVFQTFPKRRIVAGPIAGNLLWQDYRFFWGSKAGASQFSRCRACRSTLYGHGARKIHTDDTGCTNWIVEALKVMNGSSKLVEPFPKVGCAVCGKDNPGHKWGVPLCGKACIERWMFDDELASAALTKALVITRAPLMAINRIKHETGH